jgi:hypothetical protein
MTLQRTEHVVFRYIAPSIRDSRSTPGPHHPTRYPMGWKRKRPLHAYFTALRLLHEARVGATFRNLDEATDQVRGMCCMLMAPPTYYIDYAPTNVKFYLIGRFMNRHDESVSACQTPHHLAPKVPSNRAIYIVQAKFCGRQQQEPLATKPIFVGYSGKRTVLL